MRSTEEIANINLRGATLRLEIAKIRQKLEALKCELEVHEAEACLSDLKDLYKDHVQ